MTREISDTHQTDKRIFYGWWILAIGSFINAVGVGVVYHGFTVFFLPLKRELALSSAAVSLVYGASRLEGGIEGPIIGYLIDRFGPRRLIFIGSALAGVGFLVFSGTGNFITFFLVYVLMIAMGANAGFFHPVSTVINSWFIRRRGTAFGILTASGSLGGMVMVPLLSHFALTYNWRSAAVFAGGVVLVSILPSSFFMHRSPEDKGLLPDGGPGPDETDRQPDATVESAFDEVNFTVKAALRTHAFWLLTLCISFRILVTVALSAHLIPVLVWKGMDEAAAAYLVSLYALLTIAGMLVMGWVGDRLYKPYLCSISQVLTMMCFLGTTFGASKPALYLLPVGMAITMSTVPLNWSLIGDFFGRRNYATLRGIVVVGVGIATFVSPIYAGWIFDITGSYVIVMVSFSAMLLVAALLFAVLRQPSSVNMKQV
jgi:sugar phosphate permease